MHWRRRNRPRWDDPPPRSPGEALKGDVVGVASVGDFDEVFASPVAYDDAALGSGVITSSATMLPLFPAYL